MKRSGMFIVLHRLVGRALCRVGMHRWENKNAPTLRCVRCKRIVCLWAIGLAHSGLAEKLREIDNEANTLDGRREARKDNQGPGEPSHLVSDPSAGCKEDSYEVD